MNATRRVLYGQQTFKLCINIEIATTTERRRSLQMHCLMIICWNMRAELYLYLTKFQNRARTSRNIWVTFSDGRTNFKAVSTVRTDFLQPVKIQFPIT